MDEDSSLVNPAFKKSKSTLILWWILNVAIVLFVFLAFVMSTASFVRTTDLSGTISNNYYGNGGVIENKFAVGHAYTIKKGSVTSYCDDRNAQLCEGLGPVWGRPFGVEGVMASWTPAILNSNAQLSHLASIYVHVVSSDLKTIRASYIDTQYNTVNSTVVTTPTAPDGTTNLVTSLHARAIDGSNAVIMYTTANETYLQAISASATGILSFAPQKIDLFHIYDPSKNGTLVRNVAVLGNWVVVTHAYHDEGASYSFYKFDNNNAGTKLTMFSPTNSGFGIHLRNTVATQYLGNGYFLQASATTCALGQVDFNANTIKMIKSINFDYVDFYTLSITQMEGDLVVLVGTQIAFVDTPLTISMIVQWFNTTTNTPLIAHVPTNLLVTHNHLVFNDQVSVCYHPPTDYEPHGGVFFSYVDGFSRRAKIARARPVWTGYNVHLLPSPSLDISTHEYGKYHSWLPPHLTCAVSNNIGMILMAIQDFNTVFNAFYWSGGYRFAGISQDNGPTGQNVNVVRAGVSNSQSLIPGFTYYAWNNGSLAPFTSTRELFSPNGYPFPIGTAITETKLHIATDAFERFDN